VGWFNSVDDAYRSEFRDLFEVHFARADAKLDQRVGQLDAKLEAKIEQRFGQLDAKLERRVGELEGRIGALDAKIEQRVGELEAKVGRRLAEMKAELIKGMFAFWVGNLAVTGGLVFAAVSLVRR
jgi:DNA anti-recombination protein RmuC